MTPPIRTHGNAQSWRSYGYQDRMRVRGPIVPLRPEGEPPLWLGTLIVLAVFCVIGMMGVLM
jgi:hypothetical protein